MIKEKRKKKKTNNRQKQNIMLKTIKKLQHIKYEVQRRIQHCVSYLIEAKKQNRRKKINKKEKQK